MNLIGLNELDLLLIIFILLGIMYGALRGGMRQIVGLLSAWLALIICLWLYLPFSRRILKGVFLKAMPDAEASNAIFDTFAFVMLLIVFAGIVQWLFLISTRAPEEKKDRAGRNFMEKANQRSTFSLFNFFVGLGTGFVTTMIWLSLFLVPVQYAVYSVDSTTRLEQSLQAAMGTSALLPFFHRVLYWIYLSISMFMPPSGLPTIFRGPLQAFL